MQASSINEKLHGQIVSEPRVGLTFTLDDQSPTTLWHLGHRCAQLTPKAASQNGLEPEQMGERAPSPTCISVIHCLVGHPLYLQLSIGLQAQPSAASLWRSFPGVQMTNCNI